MKRTLLSILSGLLLLVSLALSAEALRGFWRLDRLSLQSSHLAVGLTSNWGRFSVCIGGAPFSQESLAWTSESVWRYKPWGRDVPGLISSEWDHAGIAYVTGWYYSDPMSYPPQTSATGARFRLLDVPSWLLPLIAALLPAWWFPHLWRDRRTRRRRARGLCGACGYDVRGISDRCPECGQPVSLSEVPAS